MELGTFGAVMGFASQLVMQSASYYETTGKSVKNAELKAVLQILSEDGKKDYATMEQTRRENVTEMILEPITGLDREEYEISPSRLSQESDTGILKSALLLEERECKFFRDSSGKIPLPEVARVFRKVAQKKEKNLIKLRSVGSNLI